MQLHLSRPIGDHKNEVRHEPCSEVDASDPSRTCFNLAVPVIGSEEVQQDIAGPENSDTPKLTVEYDFAGVISESPYFIILH